jgi:hypothetical protein
VRSKERVNEVEKIVGTEVIKIIDGCYYGQAMTFDENQIIKEFIEQQQKENEKLKKAFGLMNRKNQKYSALKEILTDILND